MRKRVLLSAFGTMLLGAMLAGSLSVGKVNSITVEDLVGPDNVIHGEDYDKETNIWVTSYIQDEPIYDLRVDGYTRIAVEMEGRPIIRKFEDKDTGETWTMTDEYYPYTLERDNKEAWDPSIERDPNVLAPELQDYLDTLAGGDVNIRTMPIGKDSYYSYLDNLLKAGIIYEEEREEWAFTYRKYNNCLTQEDLDKIKAEEEEEKRKEEENDKAWQDIINGLYPNTDDEPELTVTDWRILNEVDMIKRHLLKAQVFDEKLFISLRYQGVSYLDAFNKSVSLDFGKIPEDLNDAFESNKGFITEAVKGLTTDTLLNTMQNIASNWVKFLEELISGPKN